MKISVVIDVYNSQAYIVDAVESVLKQTYLPFELIIVDDGSTDETVVNIKNCIQNVPFARLIEKENGGQLSCLSRGILAAKGDLIALLDGDDMWKPNHLEEALEAFNKHADISLYFCNYECIGGEYNGAKKFVGGRIPSTFALTYLSEAFVGNVTSTLVAKADRLKPYLPFPLELEKDWVINADNPIVWLTSFSGRAKYSNKNCNIYYRVHEGNMHKTSIMKEKRALKRLATKRLFEYFRREFYIPAKVDTCLEREHKSHSKKCRAIRRGYLKASRSSWNFKMIFFRLRLLFKNV